MPDPKELVINTGPLISLVAAWKSANIVLSELQMPRRGHGN